VVEGKILDLFSALFKEHLLTEHSYKTLFTYKIFVQRSYSPEILEFLVDFLALKFLKEGNFFSPLQTKQNKTKTLIFSTHAELSWVTTFSKLLDVWSDASFLKHASEDRHKSGTFPSSSAFCLF